MSYSGTTITSIFTCCYIVFVIWSVPSLTKRDVIVIIEITTSTNDTIVHKNKAKKKFKAGKGAEGTILTRFIHPKQPLPDSSNPNHRSNVIVEDQYNENGKLYYKLRYFDNEPGLTSLYAHHRYVTIAKEGDKSLFLTNNKSPKEKNQRLKGQNQLQGGF